MDPVSDIRQMMAEAKFNEALKTVELYLSIGKEAPRSALLPVYLELLELQDKELPEELLIEIVELAIDQDVDKSITWLEKLPAQLAPKNFRKVQLLKIKVAEKKGRLQQLYELISEFKLRLFEKRIPLKNEYADSMVQKYFKNDFHLKLQDLALGLMLGDITKAEVQVGDLIISCVEKAVSTKRTREKLLAVSEIIKTCTEKKRLEIYQNYCSLAAHGISEKSEYKKLVEIIIYFDDFRFQVLVLDLIEKLGLKEAAEEYAQEVKGNKRYNFVYIAKCYSHLNKFFARSSRNIQEVTEKEEALADYALEEGRVTYEEEGPIPGPVGEEESLLISLLKFQSYSPSELIELTIGFLQSEYFRAACCAAGLAMQSTTENPTYLKAAWLKANGLFRLADFRAVLDLALGSLDRAERQDDILSFLYLQAEAYARLGLVNDARCALKKVLSIDSHYRLARERLERLDEV